MTPDLDQAVEQFLETMDDAFGNEPLTPEGARVAVAALLAAGWRPPEVAG